MVDYSDIEPAESYYVIPLGEDETDSLMWVGDRKMAECLADIMKPEELIATTGIYNSKCYLFMSWDLKIAGKKIKQAERLNKKKDKELIKWMEEHPPKEI